MTKKMSDQELEKISGAGDKGSGTGYPPQLDTDQNPGGPGPANEPDAEATGGATPSELERG